MKKISKRVVVFVMLLTIVAGFKYQPVKAAGMGDYTGKTVILHTNDVHGKIKKYAKLETLKKEFESAGAKVILADAGDYSQGDTAVSVSKGANAITMINAVKYDVITLGNHEFDFGADKLIENMSGLTNTKVVCADFFKDNSLVFDANTIIDKGGVKVGFFGLATPETQTKSNPAKMVGLKFLDKDSAPNIYECAQAQIDVLRSKGADIVICLAHLGVDDESIPYTSYDVYNKLNGLDFMIDGHSHTVMEQGKNGEKIQSTGSKMDNIGVIVIDEKTKKIEKNYNYNLEESDIEPDKAIKKIAKEIIDELEEEYGKVFAKTEVDLQKQSETGESNTGDLIADAFKWFMAKQEGSIKVDDSHIVSVLNGGSVRSSINKGDIKKSDIKNMMPFENTATVIYARGSQLLEILETSTFSTPGKLGGFPQVSGMTYSINTTKAYNAKPETFPGSTYYGPASIERVMIENINGQLFNPDDMYAIITNDFCSAGGDTYYLFSTIDDKYDTGFFTDEVVMDYILEGLGGIVGEEYAVPQGRIKVHTNECVGSHIINFKEPTTLEDGYTGDTVCDTCAAILSQGNVLPKIDEDDRKFNPNKKSNDDHHKEQMNTQKQKSVLEKATTNKVKSKPIINEKNPKTGNDDIKYLIVILVTSSASVIIANKKRKSL